MKTINLFFGLLIALTTFTSCSSDDDNSTNENNLLIGVWSEYRYKSSDFNNQNWYTITEPITLEFKSNGTFIDRYNGEIEATGSWSISGNKLTMDWGDEIIHTEILLLNEISLQLKETFNDGWEIYEYTKN